MQISNKSDTKEIEKMVHTEIKDVIGFILFFIIFIIAVPIILFKYKLFNVIEVYLPNVDLIANLLTWVGGPYDIWLLENRLRKKIFLKDGHLHL